MTDPVMVQRMSSLCVFPACILLLMCLYLQTEKLKRDGLKSPTLSDTRGYHVYIYPMTRFTREYYNSYQTKYHGDSGLDLVVSKNTTVYPGSKPTFVPLNIRVILLDVYGEPSSYYMYCTVLSKIHVSSSPAIINADYREILNFPVRIWPDETNATLTMIPRGTCLTQLYAPNLKPMIIHIVSKSQFLALDQQNRRQHYITERGERVYGSSGGTSEMD